VVVAEGLTEIDEPVPTEVPPQPPEYHFHDAPDPSEPPWTLSVDELPLQIVVGLAVAPVGDVDLEFRVYVAVADSVSEPTTE
jgi:hypothetical protein